MVLLEIRKSMCKAYRFPIKHYLFESFSWWFYYIITRSYWIIPMSGACRLFLAKWTMQKLIFANPRAMVQSIHAFRVKSMTAIQNTCCKAFLVASDQIFVTIGTLELGFDGATFCQINWNSWRCSTRWTNAVQLFSTAVQTKRDLIKVGKNELIEFSCLHHPLQRAAYMVRMSTSEQNNWTFQVWNNLVETNRTIHNWI